jgi:STE24 endopeptidase
MPANSRSLPFALGFGLACALFAWPTALAAQASAPDPASPAQATAATAPETASAAGAGETPATGPAADPATNPGTDPGTGGDGPPSADELGSEPAPTTASATDEASATAPDAGPVAVPEPSEKAMAYYRSGNWLWLVTTLWGLVIAWAWIATGWSARLRSFASRLGKDRWYPTVALYFVLFSLAGYVIDLPLAYYSEYVRPHAYELSNQTFGKWFGDGLKGLAVGLVMAVLFAWVPFWFLRKSPRRWWLWTAALVLPFTALMVLVQPVWIDPLFNKFGAMKDQTLERDILALAERAGIEGSRVFEVDKSVDTKAVNAYVTGMGDTKRIVLWDTIIAKLSREQLLFVMGHEMGHYVLGHVWRTLVVVPLVVLVGLWLIHRSSGALLARYGERWGFTSLSDVAAAPFLGLLFSLFMLVVSPLFLAYSRGLEHEADIFGLELTRDNHAAASAFVVLQQENLGNPRPGWLYKLWRSSHPPLGERIDFCNTYRPWETGAPLAFGEHFE